MGMRHAARGSGDVRLRTSTSPGCRSYSLIKTLLKAGIITERTRAHYGMWVNLDELVAEGDRMVGDEVAEEGIRSLKEINAGKRKVVRRISG